MAFQQQQGGMLPPPASANPQLKMAAIEMEGMTDMFARMRDLCFDKCLCIKHVFPDADLNVGEMSCTDRCAGKFMEVQTRVGQGMQQLQQEQAAQQAAMSAMPGQQ